MQNSLFTEPNSQKPRARDARDPVAELAAMVESMAARKCSTRQIVEAVRTFANEASTARQASAETAQPSSVWIVHDSPEWRAWAMHWRETRGMSPPLDRRGGWRFPSRWPAEMENRANVISRKGKRDGEICS